MLKFWKCKHPFESVIAWGRETVSPVDEDFELVTQQFICQRCSTRLEKRFSAFVGGVDAFLSRGDKAAGLGP